MANKRVFYACQAVTFAGFNEANNARQGNHFPAKGVQSVGITTSFNLEQIFELGQIQIYENIEGVPDVEVTIEKVFDGTSQLIALATPVATNTGTASSLSLVGRSKERCTVGLGVFDDAATGADAGAIQQEIEMKGMYLASLSYNFPTDGNVTESISLVGNSKVVGAHGIDANAKIGFATGGDSVANKTNKVGGIQRRENIDVTNTIIPTSLPGVQGNGKLADSGGTITAHVQNISISTDFSREDIFELGRKAPYHRAPNFPIEVTCDIEMIAIQSDNIDAYEEGHPNNVGQENDGDNTPEENIVILLQDKSKFDLGCKNRLSSITYGGGDTSGGQATVTYSYTNFNDLTISGGVANAAGIASQIC